MYNAFADKDENPELPGSDWDHTFSEENATTTVSITIYNESLERLERILDGFTRGMKMSLSNLENLLATLKDALGEFSELRAAMVDDRHVHRAQDAVRDRTGARNVQKMASLMLHPGLLRLRRKDLLHSIPGPSTHDVVYNLLAPQLLAGA